MQKTNLSQLLNEEHYQAPLMDEDILSKILDKTVYSKKSLLLRIASYQKTTAGTLFFILIGYYLFKIYAPQKTPENTKISQIQTPKIHKNLQKEEKTANDEITDSTASTPDTTSEQEPEINASGASSQDQQTASQQKSLDAGEKVMKSQITSDEAVSGQDSGETQESISYQENIAQPKSSAQPEENTIETGSDESGEQEMQMNAFGGSSQDQQTSSQQGILRMGETMTDSKIASGKTFSGEEQESAYYAEFFEKQGSSTQTGENEIETGSNKLGQQEVQMNMLGASSQSGQQESLKIGKTMMDSQIASEQNLSGQTSGEVQKSIISQEILAQPKSSAQTTGNTIQTGNSESGQQKMHTKTPGAYSGEKKQTEKNLGKIGNRKVKTQIASGQDFSGQASGEIQKSVISQEILAQPESSDQTTGNTIQTGDIGKRFSKQQINDYSILADICIVLILFVILALYQKRKNRK